jgi:hypothetical protein
LSAHLLRLLPDRLAVCRLLPTAPWPALPPSGFVSATRTTAELSVVCGEGWRCLRLEGPFELTASGILAPLAQALAAAGVSVLPIATYDTDYLLVREAQLAAALEAARIAGWQVAAAPCVRAAGLPEPEGSSPG